MEKFSWKYFKAFSDSATFPRGSKNQIVFRKVQLFWEGHKNLHHPPYGFDVY